MSTLNFVFGPVPSRRLGRSLGINNIPPKICTYSCVYCQVGRTDAMSMQRRAFYSPEEIVGAVRTKLALSKAAGEAIDYLTFVPDGEPTLDVHLGHEIALLREFGIPIAVITNASLIGQADVQADLGLANWVSLKVDAATEAAWRAVNRPHAALSLSAILQGARQYTSSFGGTLVTETMLVGGVNDDPAALSAIADHVAGLRPAVAYIAAPTRPPAETWVRPPTEDALHRAYQLFKERIDQVEFLIGYEGNAFACTGNAADDLLAITAVHPMREDAVATLLAQAARDWSVVHALCEAGELVKTIYMGQTYFVRRLHPAQ